jgi:hypothetical protein
LSDEKEQQEEETMRREEDRLERYEIRDCELEAEVQRKFFYP